MTIKVGEALPETTLFEYVNTETEVCSIGPNPVNVPAELAGKKLVIFALPGAYTPTCSERHVPGYIEHEADFKAKGVDEIWCVSVNDAFVMGAWGRALGADGKVRMMGDGAADFTRKLGLEQDLSSRGMGVRSQRYSMIVENGVLTQLNLEGPGEFDVSSAEATIKQL